jgi:hypothetical protein
MLRRNREIVIFNLSAIDLFCSGMGAVMVLMVLLMPYYGRKELVPPIPPEPVIAVTPPAPPIPPELPKPAPEPGVLVHDLELMIVMDTTSSMGGAIEDLRRTLGSILSVLSRLSENLKVGIVAYRDDGDEYVVRGFTLRRIVRDEAGMKPLRDFIGSMTADGGGDIPEAVSEALAAATASDAGWTPLKDLPGRSRQVILVVADAPGHDSYAEKAGAIAKAWQSTDARRGVYCASPSASADYFGKLAAAGNGRAVGWSDMLTAILDVVIDRK